jgi:hypothetical protein
MIELKLLCFIEPSDPSGYVELDSFLLSSLYNILIVIPLSKLPKYPWSLLY